MKGSAYELTHLDKRQILAAARRALISANGRYYAWSPGEQERFRATLSGKELRKIRCVLLDALLGIKCTTEQVDEVWNNIPLSDLNQLNWASLLTTGIGEDYLYLNECMAEGETLLDFPTLYDYDYADYLFQEEACKRDFPGYKNSDYYAYKHPSWVRLLIDGQFHYSTFTSLSTYVLDEIEAAGEETIRQLIPHKYVDGKDHGKKEESGFRWDMQIDAAGHEAQLDELKNRWYTYQQERWKALSETNKDLQPAVYTQSKKWDDDPQRVFIFANEATLKQLRWTHFLSDCESLMAGVSVVEELLVGEIGRTTCWLTETHKDILHNFDPNIVKLGKKRKIIMSASALDDLRKIDEDEELF